MLNKSWLGVTLCSLRFSNNKFELRPSTCWRVAGAHQKQPSRGREWSGHGRFLMLFPGRRQREWRPKGTSCKTYATIIPRRTLTLSLMTLMTLMTFEGKYLLIMQSPSSANHLKLLIKSEVNILYLLVLINNKQSIGIRSARRFRRNIELSPKILIFLLIVLTNVFNVEKKSFLSMLS